MGQCIPNKNKQSTIPHGSSPKQCWLVFRVTQLDNSQFLCVYVKSQAYTVDGFLFTEAWFLVQLHTLGNSWVLLQG